MERKLPIKNLSKCWVYLAKLSYVLEILENAVPFAIFATGNCLKFKPDVLVEWKFRQLKLSLTGLVSLPYDAFVTIQSEQRLENADDQYMSKLVCFLGRISVFVLKTSTVFIFLFATEYLVVFTSR